MVDSVVISDGSDNNNGPVPSVFSFEGFHNTTDGHWGLVDASHEESLQHYAVEFWIGSTGQETVQLEK